MIITNKYTPFWTAISKAESSEINQPQGKEYHQNHLHQMLMIKPSQVHPVCRVRHFAHESSSPNRAANQGSARGPHACGYKAFELDFAVRCGVHALRAPARSWAWHRTQVNPGCLAIEVQHVWIIYSFICHQWCCFDPSLSQLSATYQPFVTHLVPICSPVSYLLPPFSTHHQLTEDSMTTVGWLSWLAWS